ncbi:MAG: antibiotic biosynthesis monooxygenase [Pseudomonadota bacterium]
MYVQIVTLETLPENRERLLEALRRNAEGSRTEPENVRFDVLADADDPNRFTVYEVFSSEDALEAHRATAHYRACRAAIDPITVAGSKRIYEAVSIEDRER